MESISRRPTPASITLATRGAMDSRGSRVEAARRQDGKTARRQDGKTARRQDGKTARTE
jgi:hypothetical protein